MYYVGKSTSPVDPMGFFETIKAIGLTEQLQWHKGSL